MRRTVQRRTAAGFIALLAVLLPSALPASAAQPSPDVIVLDGATSAEGIAAGRGTTFYAGELLTGDIFKGDVRTGVAKEFIDAPKGREAVGMKFDVRNNLLFVAGGTTGKAFVYDTSTGKSVAKISLGTGFINDVTLTNDGAWFTNSAKAELYFLPVGRRGELGRVCRLPVKGEAGAPLGPNEFGLNGIAAAKGDRVLIVAHSKNGALYTVNPETGDSARIRNASVPNVDGILVRGKTVWAVQNFGNQISRIKLNNDLSAGVVKDTITSPDFNIPTTVALFGNTLAAVNAKFGQQASQYEVVLVPARQHDHED